MQDRRTGNGEYGDCHSGQIAQLAFGALAVPMLEWVVDVGDWLAEKDADFALRDLPVRLVEFVDKRAWLIK